MSYSDAPWVSTDSFTRHINGSTYREQMDKLETELDTKVKELWVAVGEEPVLAWLVVFLGTVRAFWKGCVRGWRR